MLRQLTEAPGDASIELLHDGKAVRRYRGRLVVLPADGMDGEVLLHPCAGEGIDAARMEAGPVSVRAGAGASVCNWPRTGRAVP